MFGFPQRIRKGLAPAESWGPDRLEDRINYKYAKEFQNSHALLSTSPTTDDVKEKQTFVVVGDAKNGHML